MGRRKLPLKRITDESMLQVIQSKRKHGLIKKAYELSVLSDVDVAFISVSGAGRVTSFSPTTSVEDLFQKYMNGHDPDHDFSDAERERILRTLHNIKMRNSHYNPQNDEIPGLQQELRTKREELSSLKDQLSKYQPKENEVIRSAHGHLARERLLAQTLERVQQRLSFLYQNENSLEDSSQQPLVHNHHMTLPQMLDNQGLLENWNQSQLMLMPIQGESSSNYQNQRLQIHDLPSNSANNQIYEQFINKETITMPMSMNNMNDIGNIPIDVQRQLQTSFYNHNYQPFRNPPRTNVHANNAFPVLIPTASEANALHGSQQIEGGTLGGDITSRTPGEDEVQAYLANLGEGQLR